MIQNVFFPLAHLVFHPARFYFVLLATLIESEG
jgi:hypothetical protein